MNEGRYTVFWYVPERDECRTSYILADSAKQAGHIAVANEDRGCVIVGTVDGWRLNQETDDSPAPAYTDADRDSYTAADPAVLAARVDALIFDLATTTESAYEAPVTLREIAAALRAM